MSSTNLIYIADEKFIKNIDTVVKLRYIPLINKYGIDTKIISSNTAFMYIIGYGYYAKFKTLNIIDKKNKVYSKLVNHYKLCDVSNMYFIRYCDINYFENTIKIKDYKEYCIKNDKKYVTLPKDIDLMNIITYDITTLNSMAIISNDSSLSTNTNSDKNCNQSSDGDSKSSDGDSKSSDSNEDEDEDCEDGSSDGDSDSDDDGDVDDDDGNSEGDQSSGSDESDKGDSNIIPILWNPCTNQLKHNEYIKHIYTCKKCEFINNNNNLIFRKKKVKVISGKYKKIVDAYLSSTIYNRHKYKNNPIMLIAKINNTKSFYNEYSFLI
jgi:hypothetical protein